MKAVIVTGGKQYTVSEGDILYIEKLEAEAEATIKFDQVLAVLDGESSKIGAPVVDGASVEAKVIKNGKAKKITVFKYKPKKNEKKKISHRQPYTKVEITKIALEFMTKCEFFRDGERITGFSVSGHSGYAEAGADIVCAAISAVVGMTEATVNDVCGGKAKVRVKQEDARITLTLPASCDEEDTIQAVLAGMMVYLIDLRDQYPDYIEVLEV